MEGKGTDPLQPHTPNYQTPGTAASAGAHYLVQASPRVQASVIASSKGSQKLTDSAYNSEHEQTPEQQEGHHVKELIIGARPVQADLWRSFNTIGNEMIVTKPGR